EIAKRTLTTREDSLQLIRTRDKHGVGTRLDVRQGEQLILTAKQAIVNIEQSIEEKENQISLLLGHSPGPITRGYTLTEQTLLPSIPAGLPSAMLDRRPDIRLSEQTLVAGNANIGVAKAAYFPRISLTGLMGFPS